MLLNYTKHYLYLIIYCDNRVLFQQTNEMKISHKAKGRVRNHEHIYKSTVNKCLSILKRRMCNELSYKVTLNSKTVVRCRILIAKMTNTLGPQNPIVFQGSHTTPTGNTKAIWNTYRRRNKTGYFVNILLRPRLWRYCGRCRGKMPLLLLCDQRRIQRF